MKLLFFNFSLLVLLFKSFNLCAGDVKDFDLYFKGKVQKKASNAFVVSWIHPRDELIVDALLSHIENAHTPLGSAFGLSTKNKRLVPVEIYPDLKSFSEVSGLSMARFKATGTIALTLDQRLMILSPRVLVQGYPWAETVVHEYVHYLIREISPELIPIWLHEGVAQMYQGFPYKTRVSLEPSQWGLFSKYKKQRQLLSLKTLMEPFPYRKNPEEASLAYVQALLFSQWLDQQCGVVKLIELIESLGQTEKGLEKCTKMTAQQIEAKFIPEILGSYKIPNGSEIEFFARDLTASDTFNSEGAKLDRRSRNFAQLSQELFKQGRYKPAIVEMEKAFQLTSVRPPSWSRHLALSYEKSGNSDKARSILEASLQIYPEDAASWFLTAQHHKKPLDMWKALLRAFFINPFMDGLIDQMQQIKSQNPNFEYSLFN